MQPTAGAVAPTLDPSLFNEADADAIVKAVQLIHNKKVIILSMDNTTTKVILYKEADGTIKMAVNWRPVSRDELKEHLETAEAEATKWREALADYDMMVIQTPPS